MYFLSLMEPVIASYKQRKKLTQERAVATRLGVEPSALANYRKGERRMPDTALAELADGLEIPMGDLVAAANIGLVRTDTEERKFWLKRIQDDNLRKLAKSFTETTQAGREWLHT